MVKIHATSFITAVLDKRPLPIKVVKGDLGPCCGPAVVYLTYLTCDPIQSYGAYFSFPSFPGIYDTHIGRIPQSI